MMIRVLYHDGRFDMVKQWTLDLLLEQKKLRSFLRSGGWVRIGRDPLRSSSASNYHGEDRRVALEYPCAANMQ